MTKPIIAITMGDPAGIGPELIVKLYQDKTIYDRCTPVVIGDVHVLQENCRRLGADFEVKPISKITDAQATPRTIDLLQPLELAIAEIPWGMVDSAMGKAAALCLETAYTLAMQGHVQGVVAAPMNKAAFHQAGYHYYDELAYLAELTDSPQPFLMGAMDAIWTATVTEHIPFKDIVQSITKANVLAHIERVYGVLTSVGYADPRIAVAALNPHGGEGGLFGSEEIDEIAPAVHAAQVDDINAIGPVPADTVFVRAQAGEFDAVVCMYHDQANIARKLRPSRAGTTLFMGLPVVCGTTAHGTAFDIAGQGIADPGSLRDALAYAIKLAKVSI